MLLLRGRIDTGADMRRTRFNLEDQVGGLVVQRDERRRPRRRWGAGDPAEDWGAEVRAVAARIAETRTQPQRVA